jgi:hypothetical protein
MQPNVENMMAQAMQAQQQAMDVFTHLKFLTYSTCAASLVCAGCCVLMLWKLSQIQKQLAPKS